MSAGETLEEFLGRIRAQSVSASVGEHRRLKADDIKILEEYRFSFHPFQRSAEIPEAAKREASEQDREVLSGLFSQGLSFAFSDDEWELRQTGREILVKASLWALSLGFLDYLHDLVNWIEEYKNFRPEHRGEVHKMLDLIFRPENEAYFKEALSSENRRSCLELLQRTPDSSAKLCILLLGADANLMDEFQNLIIKNFSLVLPWLKTEIPKRSSHLAWERLILLLASKAPHHVSKILEVLVGTGERAGASRVLKQLSTHGGVESLWLVESRLKSIQESERLEAYAWIKETRISEAFKILQALEVRNDFAQKSLSEKQAFFEAALAVENSEVSSWLQDVWLKSGGGLFRRRADLETRMAMAKALLLYRPERLRLILEKTPLMSLPTELRELIELGFSTQEKKGAGS